MNTLPPIQYIVVQPIHFKDQRSNFYVIQLTPDNLEKNFSDIVFEPEIPNCSIKNIRVHCGHKKWSFDQHDYQLRLEAYTGETGESVSYLSKSGCLNEFLFGEWKGQTLKHFVDHCRQRAIQTHNSKMNTIYIFVHYNYTAKITSFLEDQTTQQHTIILNSSEIYSNSFAQLFRKEFKRLFNVYYKPPNMRLDHGCLSSYVAAYNDLVVVPHSNVVRCVFWSKPEMEPEILIKYAFNLQENNDLRKTEWGQIVLLSNHTLGLARLILSQFHSINDPNSFSFHFVSNLEKGTFLKKDTNVTELNDLWQLLDLDKECQKKKEVVRVVYLSVEAQGKFRPIEFHYKNLPDLGLAPVDKHTKLNSRQPTLTEKVHDQNRNFISYVFSGGSNSDYSLDRIDYNGEFVLLEKNSFNHELMLKLWLFFRINNKEALFICPPTADQRKEWGDLPLTISQTPVYKQLEPSFIRLMRSVDPAAVVFVCHNMLFYVLRQTHTPTIHLFNVSSWENTQFVDMGLKEKLDLYYVNLKLNLSERAEWKLIEHKTVPKIIEGLEKITPSHVFNVL